ncbi:hypothetical protein [Magnetofaba australis]|uniref:Uncharacterized protein n=1 Tax=Magnetofaba australis IT-1 TaxID=1434232 RepID=A0A1Y2K3Y6_9PROT|nr:hypothetical protein [Magnetofaba australis]OSM03986.1 hypothetical protein MAIT1_03768 [Magnetofaba australis IT-1]
MPLEQTDAATPSPASRKRSRRISSAFTRALRRRHRQRSAKEKRIGVILLSVSSLVFLFFLTHSIITERALPGIARSAIMLEPSRATLRRENASPLKKRFESLGNRGVPRIIRSGDLIRVGNYRLRANIIREMRDSGRAGLYNPSLAQLGMHPGENYCVITDSVDNFPSPGTGNRLWIVARGCRSL